MIIVHWIDNVTVKFVTGNNRPFKCESLSPSFKSAHICSLHTKLSEAAPDYK